MITQTYNLNLVPNYGVTVVRCSQYDSDSRNIIMNLFNGSVTFDVPAGSIVTVRGTKEDRKGFEYPCSTAGNTAQFAISDQMTLYAGEILCELRIANGDEVLGTANFTLVIEETPLNSDTAISTSEYPVYEELVRRAETSEADAQTYAQSAEASADRAEEIAEQIDPNPITSAEIDEIVEA